MAATATAASPASPAALAPTPCPVIIILIVTITTNATSTSRYAPWVGVGVEDVCQGVNGLKFADVCVRRARVVRIVLLLFVLTSDWPDKSALEPAPAPAPVPVPTVADAMSAAVWWLSVCLSMYVYQETVPKLNQTLSTVTVKTTKLVELFTKKKLQQKKYTHCRGRTDGHQIKSLALYH